MTKIVHRALDHSSPRLTMSGEFVFDASISGPRPGILVVHEAFGLNEHAIGVAERLAGLGYAALAMDLWGNRLQISEMPAVMNSIQTMISDRESWMMRVQTATEKLANQAEVDSNRLAAIGYCFGGATVMEYARSGGDVRGVVSLHGAVGPLGNDWSENAVKARLLVCTGADDPLVPIEAVAGCLANMRDGGVDYEFDIYSDTKHSFTNSAADAAGMPESVAYNARSDRRSWARLTDFLEEVLA